VIAECPKCETSHSRPEGDLKAGVTITCRECGHQFSLASLSEKPAATSFHKSPTQTLSALSDAANVMTTTPEIDVPTSIPPRPVATEVIDRTELSSETCASEDRPKTDALTLQEQEAEVLLVGDTGVVEAEPLSEVSVAKPHFPVSEIRHFAVQSYNHVAAGSLKVKIRAAAVIIILLSVVASIVIWFTSERNFKAYVVTRSPLLSGPGTTGFGVVAQLGRGEQVTIVGKSGEFAMVRDIMGRGGYVAKSGLSSEPAPVLPTEPFASCRQSPLELSIAPCRERAQVQLGSCRQGCQQEGGAAVNSCVDHCQQRFGECLGGCEIKLEARSLPTTGRAGDAAAAAEEGGLSGVGKRTGPGLAKKKPVLKKPAKKKNKTRK
jgi:hypothetical protein